MITMVRDSLLYAVRRTWDWRYAYAWVSHVCADADMAMAYADWYVLDVLDVADTVRADWLSQYSMRDLWVMFNGNQRGNHVVALREPTG